MIRLAREQCRPARGLRDWPRIRLGAKSNVSEGTVPDFETGRVSPLSTSSSQIGRWRWQASPRWVMARLPMASWGSAYYSTSARNFGWGNRHHRKQRGDQALGWFTSIGNRCHLQASRLRLTTLMAASSFPVSSWSEVGSDRPTGGSCHRRRSQDASVPSHPSASGCQPRSGRTRRKDPDRSWPDIWSLRFRDGCCRRAFRSLLAYCC